MRFMWPVAYTEGEGTCATCVPLKSQAVVSGGKGGRVGRPGGVFNVIQAAL